MRSEELGGGIRRTAQGGGVVPELNDLVGAFGHYWGEGSLLCRFGRGSGENVARSKPAKARLRGEATIEDVVRIDRNFQWNTQQVKVEGGSVGWRRHACVVFACAPVHSRM